MKFKVRHISKLFRPRVAPLLLYIPMMIGGILAIAGMGSAMENHVQRVMFLFVLFIVLLVLSVIYLFLFFLERITGAKIIIESDSVEIRKLLRPRKKIRFAEIEEVKYTHDEELVRSHRGRHGGPHRRNYFVIRPQLTFFLTSGKSVCISDKGTGYLEKRDRAKVDPSVNPDEDITLYQAYQCYCAAVDEYARQHGLQIPR